MATIEERLKILKMIEDGKITAEEGAKLLAALADSRRTQPLPTVGANGGAKWFRVRVTDVATGKTRVNIQLPMSLINVGIKVGARFAPDLDEEQMTMIAEALKTGALGKIVDVVDDEDGEHVEVFIE